MPLSCQEMNNSFSLKGSIIFFAFIVSSFSFFNLYFRRDSYSDTVGVTGLTSSRTYSSQDAFQQFGDDFYLYSAYMDKEDVIKVIGMRAADSDVGDAVWCSMIIAMTNYEVLADVHQVPKKGSSVFYAPIIITCQFPKSILRMRDTEGHLPSNLHINLSRTNASVTLPLSLTSVSTDRYQLAKCVPLLYGPINIAFLQRMLALNAAHGVDHFQLYVHPGVYSQLNEMVATWKPKFNIVIKLWTIPVKPFQVYYHGQLAMLQDCLYSMREKANLLLVADLDEFLLPLKWNLPFTASSSSRHSPMAPQVVSWVFATLDTDCLGNGKVSGKVNWKLTKYVVVPSQVRSLGVHRAVDYEADYIGRNVSAEKAIIVHCRRAQGLGDH